MKTTLKNNPELMTVICNIQAMNAKINPNYKLTNDFTRLQRMDESELRTEQERLIPLYNKAMKPIPKENKDLVKSYVDHMTEEQAGDILELINFAHGHCLSTDFMTKIGYRSFDWAKPQQYLDKLIEMGCSDLLIGSVFDYTTEKFGQISNWKIKYFDYLIKSLKIF